MPIKPENRGKYPADWKFIRRRILARAGDCCEGTPQFPDCRAPNGSEIRGSLDRRLVVLTVAHMDHKLVNHSDDNLRALCQRCHLVWDHHHNVKAARQTRRRRKAAGDLFEP